MDRTELGKITRIRTGKLDANAADDGGMYPFFTCAEKPLAINTAAYDCECVLVAGNGDLNVKYYKGKFNAYQRTYIVESSDSAQLQVPYLYRFLEHYVHNLRSQSIGGVIKYIRLSNLTDALIPLLSTAEQQQVTDCFDKIDELVSVCQRALDSLDLLVKSRFIEMFESVDIPRMKLQEVVWFQEGPGVRKQQYTKTGVKLLNVANLHDGILDTSNTDRYISQEEADGKYSHFQVDEGDLIIASSGIKVEYFDKKMGFARKEQLPLCMNTSTIRFKPLDESVINIIYFQYFLKSEDFKKQLIRQITGSAQLNFGPSHLKRMSVPLPDIELQTQFAVFVTQVDKLRFDVQQQIEKFETLKKTLMQEYFG